MWGAGVKYKCYVDKPETIDALENNICEAIGAILLNTINNVLKNWTDRAWPAGRIVLSTKKRNLRKYSVVFFKVFSKKIGIWRTQYNHKKIGSLQTCSNSLILSYTFLKLTLIVCVF